MPLFWDDLEKVYDEQSAPENYELVLRAIKMIYVLAGRGSALKRPVDNPHVLDPEDDHARIQHAIELAKKIQALAGVQVPIYYNGRKQHIEDLRVALEQGDVFDYPKEHFLICPTHCQTTLEQAQAFKKFSEIYPEDTVVGVVSTAFHLPRVARTVGGVVSKNLVFFGIDREKKRPGVHHDIACEVDALQNYSKGDLPKICKFQPENTFLNITEVLFNHSMMLQKKEAVLFRYREPRHEKMQAIDMQPITPRALLG